jgi:Tol biopolymer transport system component
MKTKPVLTIFAVIALLAQMPIITRSQNNNFAPEAAACFSQFSMPQNLGTGVNSASSEQHPVISPNGLSLYFASDRPGGQGSNDIYVAQRPTLTSAWGAAQNLGATVNSASGESPGSISPDGREMFIISNRPGGSGGVDIWVMTRTDPNNDFGWSAPVNIGSVVNTTFADQNPNYFVDPASGTGTLYFASDRSSGTADVKDFFQSTRNPDGTFNAPTIINELNSPGDEVRTAISRDGLEIFFSSRRAGANTNIFVSTRASVSSPWNPPVLIANLNVEGSGSTQPALSSDGTVLYFVSNRPGGSGVTDLYSTTRVSVNRTATADFDGDGRTDFSVFRPSDGTWYILHSGSNTFRAQQFGTNGDRIVPGDYDGDGRTDFAVFRQVSNNGIWYILQSSDNAFRAFHWGFNTDKPVPGDYDGDGRTDIAVYRDGAWYIMQSSNGSFSYQQFGLSSDIPVAANIQ